MAGEKAITGFFTGCLQVGNQRHEGTRSLQHKLRGRKHDPTKKQKETPQGWPRTQGGAHTGVLATSEGEFQELTCPLGVREGAEREES